MFWRLLKSQGKAQVREQQRLVQAIAFGGGNYKASVQKDITEAWAKTLEADKWTRRIDKSKIRRQIQLLEKIGAKVPARLLRLLRGS